MTKAYSYLRFSTPEQAQGDSFRRQSALARDYVERQGLELDDTLTFHDMGVSAFRGKNATTGALSAFLQKVQDGDVETGSALLVENLDRISRETILDAQHVLTSIIREGITVVTLADGRSYSRESIAANPFDLIMALVMMIRGNDESATKSRRLAAAWQNKRTTAVEKPLTSRGPAWLLFNPERGRFEPIKERAAVVKRIFKMAADGIGQQAIAETFNGEKVSTFGDHGRKAAYWQRSYVAKILSSEAVVGTMIPHVISYDAGRKLRAPEKDAAGRVKKVLNYYPAVVSQALFEKAQVLRAGRTPTARGGTLNSLLAGLAKCPTCGGAMTRVMKGPRTHPYLVCAKAKAGAAKHYVAVRQSAVEDALLDHLSELNDAPLPKESAHLDRAVEAHEAGLCAVNDQIENLVDALARAPSMALSKRLKGLEVERDQITADLDALRAKQAAASPRALALRLDELEKIAEAVPLNRAAFNAALRRLFAGVTIDHKGGRLILEWHHGGTTSIVYAWPGMGGRKRR